MNDWIGLGVLVLVALCGLSGLLRVATPRAPLTREQYEERLKESSGIASAGMNHAMHGLQELMNPKAAQAVAVQKDLREGHYDGEQESGDNPK